MLILFSCLHVINMGNTENEGVAVDRMVVGFITTYAISAYYI